MKRACFVLAFLASFSAWGADLVLGAPAPEISARLLDSTAQIQLSALRGHVVLVNFWATWCAPCKQEMPAIQAYYDRHKAQGFEVLAIGMDDPRDLAEVRKIAQAYTFAVALKADANFKGLGRIWRMPSSFVIDKQGLLRKNGHVGDPEVTADLLESLVTPLLAQP